MRRSSLRNAGKSPSQPAEKLALCHRKCGWALIFQCFLALRTQGSVEEWLYDNQACNIGQLFLI